MNYDTFDLEFDEYIDEYETLRSFEIVLALETCRKTNLRLDFNLLNINTKSCLFHFRFTYAQIEQMIKLLDITRRIHKD
jgi:hypothetical protein